MKVVACACMLAGLIVAVGAEAFDFVHGIDPVHDASLSGDPRHSGIQRAFSARTPVTDPGMRTASSNGIDYSNTIAFMTGWIEDRMEVMGTPGLAIALVDDQDIVWARGFGYADVEAGLPVTTDTVFRIGSISKTLTTAAALQYMEKEVLDLAEPFTHYTPNVTWKERFPEARPITVRDLMAHHSGLPGDLIRAGFLTQPLGQSYAHVVHDLAGTYPVFEPGLVNAYGNAAFILLEGVIEAAAELHSGTNRPFEEIVEDNLFQPLGMDATSYRFDKPAIIEHLAAAYLGGQRVPHEFVDLHGTGGLYSRPTDLARFMSALFAGAPVLSNETIAVMTADQSGHALFDEWIELKSGLGWDQVGAVELNYAGAHASKGGGTFTFTAMMTVLLDHKLGVVLAANTSDSVVFEGATPALQYALFDKTGILPPDTEVHFPEEPDESVTPQELEDLAGVYIGSAGYDLVVADLDALTLDYYLDVPGGGPLFTDFERRVDGWFMSDALPQLGIRFTNLHGRLLVLYRVNLGWTNTQSILSERFDPLPVSDAWSNRLNRSWVVRNRAAHDYLQELGASPELRLGLDDGVLHVQSHYATPRALAPDGDGRAWAPGLINRGDSALQIVDIDGAEHILFAGYLFGPEPEPIPPTASMAGAIANAGFAQWHELWPVPPAEPVGGVSDVQYELVLSGAPENFLLRLYEADGATLVAHQKGNGVIGIPSGDSPLILSIQPDTDGVQTGAYVIAFDIPVRLRSFLDDGSGLALIWQGPTGSLYAIESASYLAPHGDFEPVHTNIPGINLLQRELLPVPDPEYPMRFYRVLKDP